MYNTEQCRNSGGNSASHSASSSQRTAMVARPNNYRRVTRCVTEKGSGP